MIKFGDKGMCLPISEGVGLGVKSLVRSLSANVSKASDTAP